MCTDACKEGLGGVLTQNGHAIYYESRKLKEHGINYVTHDLELATIVHALKMWSHCLMGRQFEQKLDGWNFSMNTTSTSSTSKEKIINYLLHST